MSGVVELEQAARLHRAEDRWLDGCAARLWRASSPCAATADTAVEPVDPAGTAEDVR